ncbi:7871_t:CDS:2, partial [Paraglomus occultum]
MSTEQYQRSELRTRIQQRLQQRTDTTTKSSPKTFNQLPPYLQNVLPDNYTYIIKSYKELPLHNFDGAPNASFDAQFYINIASQDEIEAWRAAFHAKTGTIFRITRADKVKGIKVIYHKDFHCRHADIAAIKYMQKTYAQKAGQRRSRNTNCQCLAKIRLEKSRLSLSHPCEVRLLYNHNHRLEPAQSSNNNNVTSTLNSHIMSSTLAPPPTFLHEASPSVTPSIGTTPLGTPLIGTPSDTSTLSAQSSPKQEFADFGYGLSHSTLSQFTRETEADILIADPYYNNSLYKFLTGQNKARSHSLEMAAHFFDSFTYVPTYDEYPGASLGIE